MARDTNDWVMVTALRDATASRHRAIEHQSLTRPMGTANHLDRPERVIGPSVVRRLRRATQHGVERAEPAHLQYRRNMGVRASLYEAKGP
jgi:hypothetical protein